MKELDIDDEQQDYKLLQFISKDNVHHNVLPKRGEKDFEPVGTDRQTQALQESRQAMYDALGSPRYLSLQKNFEPMQAHWDNKLSRSLLDHPRGNHFATMGFQQKGGAGGIWLLPEETLYLLERGTIEVLDHHLPISVQHAYSKILSKDGLSTERYQVYAYLKRLGFVVIRSTTFNGPLLSDTTSLSPKKGIFRSIWHRILGTFFKCVNFLSTHIGLSYFTCKSSLLHSIIRPGLWTTYDSIYSKLRILPSAPNISSFDPHDSRFQITYNVYRPDSGYKKTNPGTPHFRIVVANTQKHSMPTLHELEYLLNQVERETTQIGPKTAKERREALGDSHKQVQKSKPSPKTHPATKGTKSHAESKRQNWMPHFVDYRKLRYGNRGIIFACVDGGMVSFLRFGDIDFSQQPLFHM